MAAPAYKRILLKLSGEVLEGAAENGPIDFGTIGQFCDELAEVHAMGIEIGLVVGGGNIFRGVAGLTTGLDQPTGDYMGMLATVINALALQSGLEHHGVPTRVMTALAIPSVAEPFIRRRAIRHLEKNRIVIFGAGTGNPYFTTDSAAALRASEIKADIVAKATKVDGVYDSDPEKNPQAIKYRRLSYDDAISKRLGVMDTAAFSLCQENKIPIVVFNFFHPGELLRFADGESVGTLISNTATVCEGDVHAVR